MTLTFTFPVPCFVCGYRNKGSAVYFGARVNKRSIRCDQYILATPRQCRECPWPVGRPMKLEMTADQGSAQKIYDIRRRKGWVS